MSSRKALTKDEKFLLLIEEHDCEDGVDPVALGKLVGLTDKVVWPIVYQLAQVNFVRKMDKRVRITDHGRSLCEELKSLNK